MMQFECNIIRISITTNIPDIGINRHDLYAVFGKYTQKSKGKFYLIHRIGLPSNVSSIPRYFNTVAPISANVVLVP